MSSANSNAADAKLADRDWRWKNSWWIWVPLVSCGFLSWLGFLVAGIRTHERRYWIAASVFAILITVGFTLISLDEDGEGLLSDLAMIPVFGSMLGAAITAGVWNRSYLTALAARNAWYVQSGIQGTAPVSEQGFLGVSRADFYAPQPDQDGSTAPGQVPAAPSAHGPSADSAELVDLNQASADQLVNQLGIEATLAARVVQTRQSRGGFRNLDDLVDAANLQPHELIRFRNKVAFSSPSAPVEAKPTNKPSGRILDF